MCLNVLLLILILLLKFLGSTTAPDSANVIISSNDDPEIKALAEKYGALLQIKHDENDDKPITIAEKKKIIPIADIYNKPDLSKDESLDVTVKTLFEESFISPDYNENVAQLEKASDFCYINTLVWILHDIDRTSDITLKEKMMYKKLLASVILFSSSTNSPFFLSINLQLFETLHDVPVGPYTETANITFKIRNAIYYFKTRKLTKFLNSNTYRIYDFYFEKDDITIQRKAMDFTNTYHSKCLNLFMEYLPDYNVLSFIELMENTKSHYPLCGLGKPIEGYTLFGQQGFSNYKAIQNLINNAPNSTNYNVEDTVRNEVIENMRSYFYSTREAIKYLYQIQIFTTEFKDKKIMKLYLSNIYHSYQNILTFATNLITSVEELKEDLKKFLVSFMLEEIELYIHVYYLINGEHPATVNIPKHSELGQFIGYEMAQNTNVLEVPERKHRLHFYFSHGSNSIKFKLGENVSTKIFDYQVRLRNVFMRKFHIVNSWLKRAAYPHSLLKRMMKETEYFIENPTSVEKLDEILKINVLSSLFP